MSCATGKHAPDTTAGPTAGERASRRPLPGRRGLPGVRAGHPARRLGVTALVAAAVAITAIVAAVATVSPGARASGSPLSEAQLTGAVGPSGAGWAYAAPVMIGHAVVVIPPAPPAPPAAPAPLALTAEDRADCPAAATACVDLARHITWLQAGGRVSFGPVRMEPGHPGSAHATPTGTFQVSWKAGPDFVSDIYDEAMPWPTFFAPGGIAFHGGSLTHWSHGCVHLTVANAYYYHQHLPIGAEVVVF
jgi:lipoprotein-anchoring transpeptidase ErfK/SrfK